jgi:hypothetical protein
LKKDHIREESSKPIIVCMLSALKSNEIKHLLVRFHKRYFFFDPLSLVKGRLDQKVVHNQDTEYNRLVKY